MSQLVTLTPRSSRPVPFLRRKMNELRSYWRGPYNLKTITDRIFSDGTPTTSGVYVSAETAFTFSAVYAAVNILSNDIAKLPLDLRKRRESGGSDSYTKSKLYKLLYLEPNPEMGSMVFRRTLMSHALTWGNGYAEIVRDGTGRPTALWPLTPDRVTPIRRQDASGRALGPLQYRVDGQTILDAKDVLHIHGLGYDGYCGYNVIDKARQVIGIALASDRFLGSFFGNGTRFGGVLTSDQDLDEDQKDEIRAAIGKLHEGPDKAFQLLILGSGFEFKQTGVTPADSNLDEIRDKAVEDVARFYRIPSHMLNVNTPGAVSYASVDATTIGYYKGPIEDWTKLWEEEINRKCIPSLEQGQQFAKFETKAFLAGDVKTRFEAYAIALDKGLYSRNEVRELEDMNPQKGEQGDLYLVQSAQIPLDKIAALADATIKKTETPPPAPMAPKEPADDPKPDPNAERAIELLRERLEAADVMAAEARRQVEAVLEERLASAQAGELASAETEARMLAAVSDAAAQTAVAEELRSQLAAKVEAEQVANAAIVSLTEWKAATEARAVALEAESQRQAAVDAQAREQAAAELAEARSALATAQDTISEQTRTLDETVERLGTLSQSVDDWKARVEGAEKRAAEDYERLVFAQSELKVATRAAEDASSVSTTDTAARAAAEASLALALEHLRASEERAAQSVAVRDRATEDAESVRAACATATEEHRIASETLAAMQQEAWTAREALDAAVAAKSELEARLEAAAEAHKQALAEALSVSVAEAAARSQVEETARQAAEKHREGSASTIAAHRALVVDIMRRMVERETDRATRAQATPEKLRRWMETFYEGHEDLMRTALLPAVRVHLAFLRSEADPMEETRRIVAAHVTESQRHLLTVLEGDADDVAASLPALLHRWNEERPAVVADRLMQRELDHVRTR